jgi:H+-transporting ATPase
MAMDSRPLASPLSPVTPASALQGLTSDEAKARLRQFGANATPDASENALRRALGKLWAPVPWMLEAAVVLQLGLGDYTQGAVIALLLVFNAALGFFQESRAQATIAALKSRLALTASARRDGVWQTVLAAELVPGDIVKLSLGHVVPADVRLIEGEILLDQSMLTGESLPIEGGPGLATYAGALVRRGEAIAEITATGTTTAFGKTAELVRTAQVASSQQKAVFGLVRNLAVISGIALILQVVYAAYLGLGTNEIVPIALTAMLAAIPIALPASFTLTSTLAARALARQGVLPTRLSAVDEAASMDVLCADKTGTLTRNELAVKEIRATAGNDPDFVLRMAGLASSEGGQDPVDTAIRKAAAHVTSSTLLPRLCHFVPFEPATKMSEATAQGENGRMLRIIKGAYAVVSALALPEKEAEVAAEELEQQGSRVLAVAAGEAAAMRIIGIIALSDPPREDSAALLGDLRDLGVRTVMLTGDAPVTATVVAREVGLEGAICAIRPLDGEIATDHFAVYAGILPEDKYRIVRSLQGAGHVVGMCGDGANDAPALRQAQIGIAVSTATDVAKSAAGMVLTEPGLGGIVAAVRQGRDTFQRILTYTLGVVTRKVNQLLFLTIGLVITGHAVLTRVLLMTTGDFLALSSSTDNVRASPFPNRWRISSVTITGIAIGLCDLIFCSAAIAVGRFRFGLDTGQLQSLGAVVMVFSGQAIMYVARERGRLWYSRPGIWVMVCSTVDLAFIACLATFGIIMTPIPVALIAGILASAALFALVIDQVKVTLFRRWQIV